MSIQSGSSSSGRAWQRMLSGRRLDLLNPSPLDVEIEDIAHGLSRVSRWNGQTKGEWAYSVAQHSLLVESLVRQFRAETSAAKLLAALLHDAPEYVIGDLITPFKAVIGFDYHAVEERLLSAIHMRFGLPAKTPANIALLIKRADRAAAYMEAIYLAGFSEDEAARFFRPPALLARKKPSAIIAMQAEEAKQAFLDRFEQLMADLSSDVGGKQCYA